MIISLNVEIENEKDPYQLAKAKLNTGLTIPSCAQLMTLRMPTL